MSQCFLYDRCNHKDCDKLCLRQLKLGTLLSNSGLPSDKWARMELKLDTDGTDLEIFKELAHIEQNITKFVKIGANLFLHSGNSGNGKTSWAIRMIQVFLDKNWKSYELTDTPVLFINVPRFLESLKLNISTYDEYAPYVLEHVMEADLVIWDDIAAKAGSDYEINKLFSLVDGRISKSKANIFTSNLNNTEMYAALGSRLASRICNMSTNLELKGADKRFLGIKRV